MIADSFRFDPHPAVELGLPRQPVEAFVVGSPSPEGPPPPLVITIPGYGQTADGEYFREKLNPDIAERYGCLVMSVNYHGILKAPGAFEFGQLAGLLAELRDCYGWQPVAASNLQEAIAEFVRWASAHGIRRLPVCMKRFLRFPYPEYLSFGFLPALDHFMALGALARRHCFDPQRVVLFGSSYGGYIANLMAKFAPHTFSLVIDNSGFARVLLRDVLAEELLDGEQKREISYGNDQVVFPFTPTYPWTLDELDSGYFSDARRAIRSLLQPGHWGGSSTRHCLFHSVADALVPIAEKDRVAELLRASGRAVDYHRIEASAIDGRVFKTVAHGMDASLRSLFEIAVPETIRALSAPTDYALKSVARFPCGNTSYRFSFAPDYGFEVELLSNPDRLDLSVA